MSESTTEGKRPIAVGVAGLGRSGWNIHVKTLRELPELYRVAAVFDIDADKRRQAVDELGARAYDSYEALLADEQVELIAVASPNLLHPPHTIAALEAGKHAVCEKPIATTVDLLDEMIEASERTGKVFAPFQNRRYESHLLKVQEVIESGRLGDIVQVRIAWHNFARRWDWQTVRDLGGGSLNNNGVHLLDHGLFIVGDREFDVHSVLQSTTLSSGDAEDHAKVTLTCDDGLTVDMELTAAAAYPQDRWHVMGTAGGLRGTPNKLEWKWVDWSSMPERPVIRDAAPNRAYLSEELTWQEDTWSAPEDEQPVNVVFYRELFKTLREGQPLFVTPQSIRRQMRVIETCREQSPLG